MKVINIHERELDATPEQAGALIDSLSSSNDALWPVHLWPRMELDRPLSRGAVGGHGPIKYLVEDYLPGQFIKFRFTNPNGFNGYHSYEIVKNVNRPVVLRHMIEMNTHGAALLTWPLVFWPLHNALLEDSLTTAQASLGAVPQMQTWSLWVRFLRWILSAGKTRSQNTRSKELQRSR